MKHVHPDGPDKNKVPAHVLGRLPKDIRYRVNTIGDVISEMGYTWYCQNAGRVTLRNTRIYDADAIMLPGRVSHELWASGKLMNYPFDEVIDFTWDYFGQAKHDSTGQDIDSPYTYRYKLTAGYLHAWHIYWNHFSILSGIATEVNPEGDEVPILPSEWLPRYSWNNHAGYIEYQPFLLPAGYPKITEYVEAFLTHADSNNLILKDEYSGSYGSATFSDKDIESYFRFSEKPDRTQTDADGDYSPNDLFFIASGEDLQPWSFFSDSSHMVDINGNPLRAAFKASYLSTLAAKLWNHATQSNIGQAFHAHPGLGSVYDDPELPGQQFARNKAIGMSNGGRPFGGGRVTSTLAEKAPQLEGKLSRSALEGQSTYLELSPANFARWDSGLNQSSAGPVTRPTTGPCPNVAQARIYRSDSRKGSGAAAVADKFLSSRHVTMYGGEDGDYGSVSPAAENLFAHSALAGFVNTRSYSTEPVNGSVQSERFMRSFIDTGRLRVIIDAKDPDNYLFAEVVFTEEGTGSVFRGNFSSGFIGSTLRVGKRTNGADSILATHQGCPIVVTGTSFRLGAGVRKDGDNWKLYGFIKQSHSLNYLYLDNEILEEDNSRTSVIDDRNVNYANGESRCDPWPKGSQMSKTGHPDYLIEGDVDPHFGMLYGVGGRGLQSDAKINAEVDGFGNPGFYFSEPEPTNNDLKTGVQATFGLYSYNTVNSTAYKTLETLGMLEDGYWTTNPNTNLTTRNEACVPFSRTGHLWRFQDMVDALNYVLEPATAQTPGPMPCDLESTSQLPYVRRKSPNTVTVELSAPTGGFIQQNMPWFEPASDQCTRATRGDIIGFWNNSDFGSFAEAYDDYYLDPELYIGGNPCVQFSAWCVCEDHPISGCWNASDWPTDDCEKDFDCPYQDAAPAGETEACHAHLFSIQAWGGEFTSLGWNPSETQYIRGTGNRCVQPGNYVREWNTTSTLAGTYQLNLHPMQGRNCIDYRSPNSPSNTIDADFYAGDQSENSYNPLGVQYFPEETYGANTRYAPTLYTGSFQISDWCRLHIVASFNQQCRSPANTDDTRTTNVRVRAKCATPSGCSTPLLFGPGVGMGSDYVADEVFDPWQLEFAVEFTAPNWGTTPQTRSYQIVKSTVPTSVPTSDQSGNTPNTSAIGDPWSNDYGGNCEPFIDGVEVYNCDGEQYTCAAVGRRPTISFAFNYTTNTQRIRTFRYDPVCQVGQATDSLGGRWELTVKSSDPGSFCNSYSITSTFDGVLSNLTVTDKEPYCRESRGQCPTDFIVGENEQVYVNYYNSEIVSYADHRSYIGNQFFWLSANSYNYTGSGSGLRLPTVTNFGIVDQIYNCTFTVS